MLIVEQRDKLDYIHAQVMSVFVYVSDDINYNTPEWWVQKDVEAFDEGTLFSRETLNGDCEDFALACRLLCRRAGIKTRLVYCIVEGYGGHCVLEADGWILDNRMNGVVERDYLTSYRWISISGYEKGDFWHKIEADK